MMPAAAFADEGGVSGYQLAGYAVLIGGGAVAAVALAPILLGAAGFTAGGIAAGSIGANVISAAAVANGGAVVAGVLVAGLQAAAASLYAPMMKPAGEGVAGCQLAGGSRTKFICGQSCTRCF